MTHEAPRSSALFSMRETPQNNQNALELGHALGAGMAPAYSQDDNIVACAFEELASNFGGPILTRRTPEAQDGKEMTSLRANGGAAWCPTNNKFYHGCFPDTGNDVFAVIVDPLTDVPQSIRGFTTQFGLRASTPIYHPANDEIWMGFSNPFFVLTQGFARIDISDNSISYVTCGQPDDYTYCSSNSMVYMCSGNLTGSGAVYRISGSGVVTTVFTKADFEAVLGSSVTNWLVANIEYIDSLNRVVFSIRYTSGATTFQQLWKINPTDDSAAGATIAGIDPGPWANILYYSSQFDRLIVLQNGVTASYDPTNFTSVTAILTGDLLTSRGCFCDTPNKVALPVLRGGVYSVRFYDAAALG